MTDDLKYDIDISSIISNKGIVTLFQPIVSVKNKSLIGLEALSRGIYNGSVVPPNVLFNLAAEKGLTLELDRLCRKKALETFSTISKSNNNLVLFLNIDTSTLDKHVVGSGNLLNTVTQLGLSPDNIVIEINESHIKDYEAFTHFISQQKDYGFIIAMDDVGAGHSNLNRVVLVKPDIIKVDMNIISNIEKDFYKQEIFKSLVGLSRNIGASLVAEGIENEEEAVTTLSFGADMLQGYYFSKPQKIIDLPSLNLQKNMRHVADKLKQYTLDKIRSEKSRKYNYDMVVNNIINELSQIVPEDFNHKMKELIDVLDPLECLYVLDESGMQVSEIICNYAKLPPKKRFIFCPPPAGTDHSLKSYYYVAVNSETGNYITDPYISLASGNLCITVSRIFRHLGKTPYILCMDVSCSK